MTKKEYFKIISWFALWRLGLFLVAFLAKHFLAYQPSFPYADVLLQNSQLPSWLYSFANFDGVHYLTIASKGYVGTGLIQAFFPLYPLLIAKLNFFGIQPLLMALIISNLFSLLMFFVFYALVKKTKSQPFAEKALLLLMIFPSSFFFGASYNESLFIFLILGIFYLAREKKWLLTGLLAFLASATRVVGALASIIIFLEAWQAYGKDLIHRWHKYKMVYLAGFLSVAGLLAYMLYLAINFNNPLYFLQVQSGFGAGRQSSFIIFPQVIWRYLKILATARPFDFKYYSYLQDLVLSLGALSILLYQLWRWFKNYQLQKKTSLLLKPHQSGLKHLEQNTAPLSLIIFSLAVFFVPTLTGTLSSMPRYILPCISIFYFLANLPIWQIEEGIGGRNLDKKNLQNLGKSKIAVLHWQIIYFLISISLLIINTALFVQGYWVG